MLKRALLLLLLSASPVLADELDVDIVVVKPRYVFLVPGGETKNVRLQGLNFELIQRTDVVRSGRICKDVHAELKTISRGIYTLVLKADSGAAIDDYKIRFRGKGDYTEVPLDLRVIDPKNPPEPPPLPNRRFD